MKKILTVFVLTATLATAVQSQKIAYENGTIQYDDQSIETINILLEPRIEVIEDKFEDWMDDNYNVNLRDKKMLFFDREFLLAEGVVIPEVSDKKLDLRVKVDQTITTATTLHLFASFGYDNWITESDYPNEYNALKEIVYEFVVDYLPEYYSEKIEDKKEIYGDLADEIEDLENDIAENREEIKENRDEIEEMMDTNSELSSKLDENRRKLRAAKQKLQMSKQRYENILDRINVIRK